jgi:hypothetical protein
VEDRNKGTAETLDRLGLAEYYVPVVSCASCQIPVALRRDLSVGRTGLPKLYPSGTAVPSIAAGKLATAHV